MRDICVNYTTAAGVRSREQGAGAGIRRQEEGVATTGSHACSQLAAVVVVGVACVLWHMRSTC